LLIAFLLAYTYFIKKHITPLHLIQNNFPDHTWPPYPFKQRRQYHTRKSKISTGRKHPTSYSTSPTYITPQQQDCGSLPLLHPLHTSGASYRQQSQPFQLHFKRKRTSYKLLNTLQQIITTDTALCTTNIATCTYSNKPQFFTNTTSRCNNAILKSHSLTHSLTAFQADILVPTETLSHTPICTQNSLFLSMYKKETNAENVIKPSTPAPATPRPTTSSLPTSYHRSHWTLQSQIPTPQPSKCLDRFPLHLNDTKNPHPHHNSFQLTTVAHTFINHANLLSHHSNK
jgi:hypothetical protein